MNRRGINDICLRLPEVDSTYEFSAWSGQMANQLQKGMSSWKVLFFWRAPLH